MTTTNTVVKTEPHMMGMSNSICKAMAPPNISASEVEMEASTAVPNMGRDTQEGVYLVAASGQAQAGYNSQMRHIMLQYNQHDSG